MSPNSSKRIHCGSFFVAVLLWLTLSSTDAASKKSAPPPVANPQDLSSNKENLDDLRQRIDQLKKDVAVGETVRSEAADQLREHEKAISDLQRELHELGRTRESHLLRQNELGTQTLQAEKQLSQQQSHLDRLLVQQYMTGSPGPLHLLLSGQSPNQTARDMTYLGVIAQARQGVVTEAAQLIAEKKRLADETRQQTEAIAGIEAQQRKQQEAMLAQRQQRQKMLAGISSRLDAQRREIETLRRDEQRLARLIDRITKLLAQKARDEKSKVERANAERAKAEKSDQTKRSTAGTPEKRARSSNPLPADTAAPERGHRTGNFAALRGKLTAPTNGAVSQKFGAAQDGGGRSKGIFIRSAASSEVRAVAGGQVVFADWLRGFGNLIVIDHGDGYLSIYGYNEAVLKQVGDDVRAGDRIAAVGNSGGRSETGLYFELRRQGEAIDPGRWLRR